MKRPAFQFYPADWAKDLALRSCSLAARGLWMEILCMAHESETYGCLVVNGIALTDAQIVNSIAGSSRKLLTELERAGVFSRTETGAIFSRRMVKDERLRKIRAACGQLGGNPVLLADKDNQKPTKEDNQEVNQPSNQMPTPSSSSSSSPSGLDRANSIGLVDNSPPNPAAINAEKAKPQPTPDWWRSNEGIEAKGKELGIAARNGEEWPDYKARLFEVINAGERRSAA